MLIPRSDSSDGVFMWQHSALASCGTEAVDARNMRRHWDHELRSLHETPGVLLIRSVCTFLSFALHELGTRERLGALTPGMLLMRSVCAFVSFALHARRLVRRLCSSTLHRTSMPDVFCVVSVLLPTYLPNIFLLHQRRSVVLECC